MQALTFRTRYVLTHVQHAARGGDNARGTLALDCHITTVTHGGRSHVLMTQETRRHESCSGRGSATRLDETREDGRSDVASRDRGVDPTRSGRCAFLDANSRHHGTGDKTRQDGGEGQRAPFIPGRPAIRADQHCLRLYIPSTTHATSRTLAIVGAQKTLASHGPAQQAWDTPLWAPREQRAPLLTARRAVSGPSTTRHVRHAPRTRPPAI